MEANNINKALSFDFIRAKVAELSSRISIKEMCGRKAFMRRYLLTLKPGPTPYSLNK